jgi:methionine-rich copper-binding protein CopC
MRRALCAAWGAALLALADVAGAHAILIDSQPKPAAEVQGPDVEVSLEFNSRIDASRSSLSLAHDDGVPGPAAVGAGAQSLHIAESSEPNKLATKLLGLEPGSYRLRWQVLSVDGHVSRGDVKFKVRAP